MFDLADLSSAVSFEVLQHGSSPEFSGANINSQTIQRGELFFALQGHQRDGHEFVEAALASGAAGAVVSRAVPVSSGGYIIRVDDTLDALQKLARVVRRKYNPHVVAVTGSAGKTTTKEMVACVLQDHFSVVKSPASFNNHIGVPLTLLQLNGKQTHAVVEIGMNHVGEIGFLADLAEPDIGIITNIGYAHIEYLGSQEAILTEKASLFLHLRKGGMAIINGDDPHLRSLLPSLEGRNVKAFKVGFGGENDLRAEQVSTANDGVVGVFRYGEESCNFRLNVLGSHFVFAALSAVATAILCGMNLETASDALESFVPPHGRLNVTSVSPALRIIDDSYNASPDAMLSALRVLGELPARRKIAVLGEMRELGEFSEKCHEMIGRDVVSRATHLIAVGAGGKKIILSAVDAGFDKERVWSAESAYEALKLVHEVLVGTEDIETAILIKGSRFTHMERVFLGIGGLRVDCELSVCTLYINCKDCPNLERLT